MISPVARSAPTGCAVLWDLDGTLFDSGEYHLQAWQETMTARGLGITREAFLSTFGQRNDNVLRDLLGPATSMATIEEISVAKEARYREILAAQGATLTPGTGCWLARLRAAGWRQAVASSAPWLNVEAMLRALGVLHDFDALVSGDDVRESKPAPEIFLLAAHKLGVPPARCVVVEDSPAGIEAARRAGMRSVGVGAGYQALAANLKARTLAELPENSFTILLEG
jgi:beta-phosphoglucomutase family hydrolase